MAYESGGHGIRNVPNRNWEGRSLTKYCVRFKMLGIMSNYSPFYV